MVKLKTQKNEGSVDGSLNLVANEKKRKDSFTILELMREVTGEEPSMWGPKIVGFDNYHTNMHLDVRGIGS
ncbi:MAG: hypothetical protein ACFFFH_13050 [Candidatus Thorarchaeota archaeon]